MLGAVFARRLVFIACIVLYPSEGWTDAIRVQATPVGLSTSGPAVDRVGALVFRGGLALASGDRRFGGLSGLQVSADGSRLRAVSDEGSWLEARLEYDERGFLTGLSQAELGPILDPEKKPLKDKTWQDAESLAALPDGSVVVGFEHHHRLWRYRGERPFAGPAESFSSPPGLARIPANGGLEAIAPLKDGGFLGLTEQMTGKDGNLQGFLLRNGHWSMISYRVLGTPTPSDAAALASGDVLVLERSYSPTRGLLIRLRRIAHASIEPGALLDPEVLAELKPPLTIDNFEGLALRQEENGETLVYLLSDDNFSSVQRTLLLMFALAP